MSEETLAVSAVKATILSAIREAIIKEFDYLKFNMSGILNDGEFDGLNISYETFIDLFESLISCNDTFTLMRCANKIKDSQPSSQSALSDPSQGPT